MHACLASPKIEVYPHAYLASLKHNRTTMYQEGYMHLMIVEVGMELDQSKLSTSYDTLTVIRNYVLGIVHQR